MHRSSMFRGYRALVQSIAHLSTTRANAQLGLSADVAVSLALLAAGLARGAARPGTDLATIAAGLLAFSFVEYCFHRWLFHGRGGAMEQGHARHHQEPQGYDSLPFFLPPLLMLGLAAALATALPAVFALLLAGAVAAGYAAYGLSHHAIHSRRFRHPLARRWAAAHHIHHCHPDRNFGVTSPLWDIVLGTRYVSKSRMNAS